MIIISKYFYLESFEGIKYLIEKFGAANVYIVSKCGEKI